jgi:hypothetical protein
LPARSAAAAKKEFDTSGKSPAYLHHRKNCKSPRRETGSGFFIGNLESGFPNRTAAAFHGRTILPKQRIVARRASKRAAVRTISEA